MNIFVLHSDPKIAAQMHCDTHCVKMILETAQMLSTAHRFYNTPQAEKVYKQAHLNHPCTKWVRESKTNYRWAVDLYLELLKEFKLRRGKTHKSGTLCNSFFEIPADMPDIGLTPFPQAMPPEYQQEDAVEAYRAYYMGDKAPIAAWAWGRPAPEWYKINTNKGLTFTKNMV